MFPMLVNIVYNPHHHRYKHTQVRSGRPHIPFWEEGDEADEGHGDVGGLEEQGEVVHGRVEDVRGVYPVYHH